MKPVITFCKFLKGTTRCIVAKVLDYGWKINEFDFYLLCDIHFLTNILGKCMEIPYPSCYAVNVGLSRSDISSWWETFGRPWYDGRFRSVFLVTGYTSGLRRPFPLVLTLFGGVGFIAWRLKCPFLGQYRRGPRTFWKCQPCTRTHLKKPLCHIRQVGGTEDKYHHCCFSTRMALSLNNPWRLICH